MGSRVFTVYFRNIPETHELPELEGIFSEFGEIIKLFVHHSGTYGMVEYTNISSCNKAIESLHNVPPFNFYVAMAKSNSAKKDKQMRDTDGDSSSSTSSRNDVQLNRSNRSMDLDDPDNVFYVDRFNKVINVLVDDLGVVYAPIHRVTGVRRVVRKKNATAEDFYNNPDNYEVIDDAIEERGQRTGRGLPNGIAAPKQYKQAKIDKRPPPVVRQEGETIQQYAADILKVRETVKSRDTLIAPHEYKKSCEPLKQRDPVTPHEPPQLSSLELPLRKHMEVAVSDVVGEQDFWINIPDKQELMETVMSKVLAEASIAKPLAPSIGLHCLAKYEGLWYRALVLDVAPRLHVRYTDFGNEGFEPEGGVRALPTSVVDVPSLAVRIHLQEAADRVISVDDTMHIEAVACVGGIYQVRLGDTEKEQKAIKESDTPPRQHSQAQSTNHAEAHTNRASPAAEPAATSSSIILGLKVGQLGAFEVNSFLSDEEFVAGVLPSDTGDYLDQLHAMSDSCPAGASCKPVIGQLVAARLEPEGWCRAVLLRSSSAGSDVAFVDFGKEVTVQELRSVPTFARDIPWFSGVCTVPKGKGASLRQANLEVGFRVLERVGARVRVSITCDASEHCEGWLSEWRPSAVLPQLELVDGDRVVLVCESDGYLWVRTHAASVLLAKTQSLIAAQAKTAAMLTERPVPGQLVAARYEGEWYRAVVKVVRNELAGVLYVDFGNEERLPWKELRLLSLELTRLPITLLRVKLRRRADPKLLAELADTEAVLTVSFKGDRENSVTLLTAKGEDVCQPRLRIPARDDPRVCVDALPNQELLVGEQRVCVLEMLNVEKGMFSFCLEDVEAELKRMTSELKYYAEREDVYDPTYEPQYNEVILACHQGQWRRALLSETSEDGSFSLFYVDHGQMGIVPRAAVRRISPDLVVQAAVAYIGCISDVPGNMGKHERQLLDRFLSVGSKLHVNVLRRSETEVYLVELPAFTTALRKDRLP